MGRKQLSCLVGAVLLLGVLSSSVALGEAFIVKDGKAQAEIVVSAKPARMAKLAAEELRDYVEKITGARLPIVTEPTAAVPVKVYVGKSNYTDQLNIIDEGLDHGAFRMVSGDRWLALVGHDSDYTPPNPFSVGHGDWQRMLKEWDGLTGETWGNPRYHLFKQRNQALGVWEQDERGSLNAVHEFLRQQGVRWYLPGPLGEVVPKKPSLEVPAVDKTVRPDFALRSFFQYNNLFGEANQDELRWQLRLGLNVAPDLLDVGQFFHGTSYVIGRPEVKKAHPEYFALLGGKRVTDSKADCACLSSPGLFASNVKYARAMFDIYKSPTVSVMPPDGLAAGCQCDSCRAQYTPERGYGGQFSDYVWGYVNRVAQELYKTHPDRKVLCEAYTSFLLPPTKIKTLSPNVVVGGVHLPGGVV